MRQVSLKYRLFPGVRACPCRQLLAHVPQSFVHGGSNCCTIQTWTPDMLWKISFNMPGLSIYEELILRPLLVTKTGQAPSGQLRATPSMRNILKCLHFQNDQKSCTVTIDCLPSSCVPAFPIFRHSSASSSFIFLVDLLSVRGEGVWV